MIEVIERPWKHEKDFKCGIKAYINVEPQYLNFTKEIRVLPAESFEEPDTLFSLKEKYEVGENPLFPEGGFDVWGPGGQIRSFFLDQVIVHPFILGQKNFFKKRLNNANKTKVIDPKAPKLKRGRPSNPDTKPKEEYIPTGGKRGRPANPNTKPKEDYKPTGGKRGRPANPNAKPKEQYVPTGGKRGRPSKNKS